MIIEKISNYLKDFKDYIPVILVVFYCLGYSKMIGYYSVFDIDIEYYLSIDDFVFVAIKDMIKFLIGYLAIDMSTVVIYSAMQIIFYKFLEKDSWKKAVSEGKKQEFEEELGGLAFQNAFLLTFLALIIWILFFDWFNEGFVYLGITAVFQMGRLSIGDSGSIKSRKMLYTIIFILSFIGGFYLWGKVEGENVPKKLRVWDREVIFTYEGERFSSMEENQIFLGETSGYIFIYSPEKKSTKVISKENIEGLQIIQKFNEWTNKGFFDK